MSSPNSPSPDPSLDLEREVIKRFRSLVPFISRQCRIFRELKGRETLLCLDFSDYPQYRQINAKKWANIQLLLVSSCNQLGLANSVVWKEGKRIVGRMRLDLESRS